MKLLITFLLTSIALFAHPHVFIDVHPKINIKNNKATSVSVQWKFDLMTSSMLMMDYDKNQDRQFSKKEIANLKKSAMRAFEKNDYYLKIKSSDEEGSKVQKVDNFTVTIDELGRVVYSFDLICNFEIKDSVLIFYYKNNYISFMLKKSSVQPLNKNLDFSVKKVNNERYFGFAMLNKGVI